MEVLNGATDSGRGVRRFAFHLHLICTPQDIKNIIISES